MTHNAPDHAARARRFPLPAMFAALALALILAACASDDANKPRAYADGPAREVLAKAYETLYDKYIEPVEASDLALHGIAGLATLEPSLSVRRDGDTVRVFFGPTQIERFTAPAKDDVTGWARATVRAIDAGRHVSATLENAGAEDIYKAVLGGALAPLDPHTRYAGVRAARDYRAQREGFGGIGVRLNFDHGLPQIISVLPDTPAEASALKAGDVLIGVNGESVEGLDRDTVIWQLRGEVGTPVSVTVTRKDLGDPVTVVLKRALIVSQTVHLRYNRGFADITISGFNQRTARNLLRALDDVTHRRTRVKGIVLDLRGNPGGLLDQAVAVTDAFLDHGRIVSTRGRHPDSFQLFNATGRDLVANMPMAVLVNGQSASAAEIVTAALQDQGRAIVVGSNSYGKGTVQNITRLPNDGELVLTWSRFYAPSGYALEKLGIMPNFCTSRPPVQHANAPVAGDTASVATLDRDVTESTIILTAWRTHVGYDAKSGEGLRERCPRRAEKPDDDLAVAERVLTDGQLYAQALGASQPSLAKSRD